MPLVITGTPTASTNRSAASSAWSAQTSVPRISTGRSARASSAAIRSIASVSGSRDGASPPLGTSPEAVLKNSSIGTSTNTGPRCADRAAVNASSMPGSTSAAVCSVFASFETDSRIGGWSSSCRLPLPQRLAGARPPTTTIGEPANCAWAIALTPLVTPGPGGEHGQARHPGELAGRLGRERRRLLVAYVEQPHRRVGLHRAVVHREHVGAGQGEQGLHAVGAGHGDRELTGVAVDGSHAGTVTQCAGCGAPR